jgi:hypothetical protein
LSHNNLGDYYRTIYTLVQHHKWDAEYVENLYPFERILHVDWLAEDMKKLKEAADRARR